MAKCERAPVNAVNVMMNTLVPTAVFSSYPRTDVRIRSIIIPPPEPTNPQIKPIIIPQIMDCIARFFADVSAIDSLVFITGRTINFIPSRNVINTEKPPIVADGRILAT